VAGLTVTRVDVVLYDFGAAAVNYVMPWEGDLPDLVPVSAALQAFREVENALMYEVLLPERLQFLQSVVRDNTEAVRIARIQYEAGSIDLLSVLQLQEALIASQAEAIELRTDLLLNRIELHLALGGSFEVAPAASVPGP
jgi:outer membrane protein TolC